MSFLSERSSQEGKKEAEAGRLLCLGVVGGSSESFP